MSQTQTTIFVSNLAYALDTQDLIVAFSSYGEIKEAKIIKDRETGRSKGFGFITFQNQNDAKEALNMNGKELHGRIVRVNFARKQAQAVGE
jgi:heterogeneous nuclear ribonucleoprotein A1/A3